MRRILVGVIAAMVVMSGLLVWSAPSAYACSCVIESPDQGIAEADAIFTGTIVEKSTIPRGYAYELLVERSYKGEVADVALVESGFGGGDCGIEYGEGDQALVFAAKLDGTLSSSICASYGAGLADVERVLGPGTEPARGGDVVETTPAVAPGPLLAAVVTLVPWLGLLLSFGL